MKKVKIMLGALGATMAISASIALADQGGDDEQRRGEKIKLHCHSSGASTLGQNQVDLEAELKFTLKIRDDGLRAIEKFRGNIFLDAEQAVSQTMVARFDGESAVENVDFHPRVYKGYSQFRNINAVSVVGDQSLAMITDCP